MGLQLHVRKLRRATPAGGGGGGTGDVDLSGLSSSAAPDTTAYAALNVPGMAAGTVFSDPVTGVRTVKLTANGTPTASQYYPHYSTMGMSISQPWGDDGDWYTIAVISSSGSSYLIDYQLGGEPSNYRTFPGTEGRFAFSHAPGNERIIYRTTGSQLRRYNTETNAYADTGLFPYTWSTGFWLQLNHDDTWATALTSAGTGATALKLSDGSVINTGVLSGLDEVYGGYNNVAFVNRGAVNSQMWNLDTNSLTTYSRPNSNFGVTHVPSLRGLWATFDSNTGGGSLKWARNYEDGSCGSAMNQQNGYWGQIHPCGNWWTQAAGDNQWFLISNDQQSGSWTAAQLYNILFLNTADATTKVLGHHYSDSDSFSTGGTNDYYSQPHATLSHDGKIVLFGSNMLNSARIDAFLMEVPRTA